VGLRISLRAALTLLLATFAVAFVLGPFFTRTAAVTHVLRAALEILLVATVWGVSGNRRFLGFAAGIALLNEIGAHLALARPEPAFVVFDRLGDAAFAGTVAGFIALTAWRSRRVGTETLVAAIVVYVLLGHFFASAYSLLEYVDPGSFANVCPQRPGGALECVAELAHYPRLVYFGFVTLTTVGYGDVLPLTRRAEGLVVVTSVTGQLYLAILIGRLVGAYLAEHREEGGE
jgi:hypothetical protein